MWQVTPTEISDMSELVEGVDETKPEIGSATDLGVGAYMVSTPWLPTSRQI